MSRELDERFKKVSYKSTLFLFLSLSLLRSIGSRIYLKSLSYSKIDRNQALFAETFVSKKEKKKCFSPSSYASQASSPLPLRLHCRLQQPESVSCGSKNQSLPIRVESFFLPHERILTNEKKKKISAAIGAKIEARQYFTGRTVTPPENAEEKNFEKRQYFTGRTVTPPENAEERNFEKRQYFTGRTVTPPENAEERNFEKRQYFTGRTVTPPENAEERNFEKRQYFTGRTVTPPENAEEKNFEKRQYFTGRTVTPPENGKFFPPSFLLLVL